MTAESLSADSVVASDRAADLAQALGGRRDLDKALKSGIVSRRKVRGAWLYASSIESIEAALLTTEQAALELLQGWLLSPLPLLGGSIGKKLWPRVSRRAVQALLRDLLATDRLYGLPLLTQGYQPYYAVYSPADAVEIERQVGAARDYLARAGLVEGGNLPEPLRPRETRAWRWLVLGHCEFVGTGRMEANRLVPWHAPE